ncbi:MAG: hypothetical protein HUU20_26600 [Pirellulales bacterium]|nr:hypothetical protein [Pirellulales bacterium]
MAAARDSVAAGHPLRALSRKLNLAEVQATLSIAEDGTGTAALKPELVLVEGQSAATAI